MYTLDKKEINLEDLLIETEDVDLAISGVSQKRDEVLDSDELKNELSLIIEEYAHSNERIKELIEIYRHLIQKTDQNIEWLANSNTFKRIWRRVTGKTFRIDLQNSQYHNDLNKIGLELFNQLNQKMLIQQQQLVWLQKEINFFVNEQTEFRQKLKAQLELIIENAHVRFKRIETVLRDTTKSVLELQKELRKLGLRVDVIEREQEKIKHRLNTIEWKDEIQNKRGGNPGKFNRYEDQDFKKVTTFLSEIDRFLDVTDYSPTLTDYVYLEDVLGFYGFDKNNHLYAQDIIKLLVSQVSEDPRKSIQDVVDSWRNRFGIIEDQIDRNLFVQPISPEKPFSSFTERIILLINQEVNQGKSITYDSILELLMRFEMNDEGTKVLDHFLKETFSDISSFDELKFDWLDISKEYISFKKATEHNISAQNTKLNQAAPFDQVLRNPSIFMDQLNLAVKQKLSSSQTSNNILGWKKEIPHIFSLKSFKPKSSVSLESEASEYLASIEIKFYEVDKTNGLSDKRIRMAYYIPSSEYSYFDYQKGEDFFSAFGDVTLPKKAVGNHQMIYFDWNQPDESFTSMEQLAETISDRFISFLTVETEYTKVISQAQDKIKTLPDKFSDATIEEIVQDGKRFKLKMNSSNVDHLYLWKNENGYIFETHGGIGKKYLEIQENEEYTLGYPMSDEMPFNVITEDAGSYSTQQLFEKGTMTYSPGIFGEGIKINKYDL